MRIYQVVASKVTGEVLECETEIGERARDGERLVSIEDVREELQAFARSVGWREDAVRSYLDDRFPEA